jgi:hypothetical protein
MAAFSVFGECAKIFQQLMRTPYSIGSIFDPYETGYYIRVPREQNLIKIFTCPTGKYHSAYSPYALNELNLA